jgi:hypothetical protein
MQLNARQQQGELEHKGNKFRSQQKILVLPDLPVELPRRFSPRPHWRMRADGFDWLVPLNDKRRFGASGDFRFNYSP